MPTSFSKLYHPHAGDWVLEAQSDNPDDPPHVYQILETKENPGCAGDEWPAWGPWERLKARRYHRRGDDHLPTGSSVSSDELVLGKQGWCNLNRIIGRCFVMCVDAYSAWVHHSLAPDSVLWDPELPIFFCRRKLNFKSQNLTGMLAQGWASSTCTDATAPAEKVQWKRVREEEAEASVKKAKLDLEEKAATAQKAKDDAAAVVEAQRERKQSDNELWYWMALRFVPKPGAMLPVETAASIFKQDAAIFSFGLEWGQATALLCVTPRSLLHLSHVPNFFINVGVREAPIREEFVKWIFANYHLDPASCVLSSTLFHAYKASTSYGGEAHDNAFRKNIMSFTRLAYGPTALAVDYATDCVIIGIKPNKPYLPNPTPDSVAATHTGPHPTHTPVENSPDSALSSSSSPSSASSTHTGDAATSPAPSSPSAIHLSKLDLPSFIDHMSKVDPSRAKHYQAALPILDDALVAPDVLAALGADKLEALGLKMGLVRRMLGELEGRC